MSHFIVILILGKIASITGPFDMTLDECRKLAGRMATAQDVKVITGESPANVVTFKCMALHDPVRVPNV